MSKTQKIIVSSCLTIFCMTSVFGIWLLTYTSSETGYIVSSEIPINFVSDFSMTSVSTTNTSQSKTEYINLSNDNGAVDYNITFTETVEDVADSCTPNNDVSAVIKYDGSSVSNGESISVDFGDSQVSVETIAERFACPQNYSNEITLTPI